VVISYTTCVDVALGSGNVEELREHLDRFVDVGPRLTQDTVRLISLDEIYGAGAPVDPAQVIEKYAAATQEALADGYRGLRISADVTDLARAPEQQDAFARCEFLLERYSSQHPLSAMCEYRLELGDAVTQFACMHAAVPAGLTPFQVFACDGGAVGLLGEFDVASQTAFERALQRIQRAPDDSKLIFDMSAVRYMDHRAFSRSIRSRKGARSLSLSGPCRRSSAGSPKCWAWTILIMFARRVCNENWRRPWPCRPLP
jgi:hypothetical protein